MQQFFMVILIRNSCWPEKNSRHEKMQTRQKYTTIWENKVDLHKEAGQNQKKKNKFRGHQLISALLPVHGEFRGPTCALLQDHEKPTKDIPENPKSISTAPPWQSCSHPLCRFSSNAIKPFPLSFVHIPQSGERA